MEREDKNRAAIDAVASEEKPATFQKGPVAAPTYDQILVHDEFTDIPFQVEEAMKTLRVWNLTAKQKVPANLLSAAVESLIGLIIETIVRSHKQLLKAWRPSSITFDLSPRSPSSSSRNNRNVLTT